MFSLNALNPYLSLQWCLFTNDFGSAGGFCLFEWNLFINIVTKGLLLVVICTHMYPWMIDIMEVHQWVWFCSRFLPAWIKVLSCYGCKMFLVDFLINVEASWKKTQNMTNTMVYSLKKQSTLNLSIHTVFKRSLLVWKFFSVTSLQEVLVHDKIRKKEILDWNYGFTSLCSVFLMISESYLVLLHQRICIYLMFSANLNEIVPYLLLHISWL